MSDRGSASGLLGASALARQVGIGQQCCRRPARAVVVVYRVHRGERTVDAHLDGDDPHAAGARFQLAFRELASQYRLRDRGRGRGAA